MLWHYNSLASKSFFFVNVDDETSLVVTMVDIFPFALILGLLAQPIEVDAKPKPQKLGSFGLFTLFYKFNIKVNHNMSLGDYQCFIMQVIHRLKPTQKEQKWPIPTFDKQKSLMHKQITKTKGKNYVRRSRYTS